MVISVIGLYPLLWIIGIGFLFWPLFFVMTLSNWSNCKHNKISVSILLLGIFELFSIPIGILFFDAGLDRIVSAITNIVVWLSLSFLSSFPFEKREIALLENKLIKVGTFQGVVVLAALLIYPSNSLVPILNKQFEALGVNAQAFSSNQIIYSDWLDGAALRTHGIMANATWAGGFSALVLLLILSGKNNYRTMVSRIFRYFSISTSLLVVYLSLSRSVMISLIVSILTLAFFQIQKIFQSHDFKILINTLFLILVSATSLYFIAFFNISEPFHAINEFRAGSLDSRSAIYEKTFKYIGEHPFPLLGFGIKPSENGLVASIATHSTILGIIFKGGFLALITYLFTYFVAIRNLLDSKDSKNLSIIVFIFIWSVLEDFDSGHLIPLFIGLIFAKINFLRKSK